MANMVEHNAVELLREAVELHADEHGLNLQTRTFEESGLLTMNTGFVLTLEDGTVLQVQVLQER
jgi:hypothetical protein